MGAGASIDDNARHCAGENKKADGSGIERTVEETRKWRNTPRCNSHSTLGSSATTVDGVAESCISASSPKTSAVESTSVAPSASDVARSAPLSVTKNEDR